MPRLRTIKPGFFTNEDLADCGPHAMLLFAGLWCHADREGRLEDRPRRLKVEILPYFDVEVDALLGRLAAGGFIVRYECGGIRYLAIPTFSKHQNPHIKETASTLPGPPEPVLAQGYKGGSTVPAPDEHSACPVPAPDQHQTGTVLSRRTLDSGLLILDSGVLDSEERVKGEVQEGATRAPATPSRSPRPPDLIWDSLAVIFGQPLTPAERKARNSAVKEFRDGAAAAGLDEAAVAAAIQTAHRNWANVMDDAVETAHGIAKHFGALLQGPQVNGRGRRPTSRSSKRGVDAYLEQWPGGVIGNGALSEPPADPVPPAGERAAIPGTLRPARGQLPAPS